MTSWETPNLVKQNEDSEAEAVVEIHLAIGRRCLRCKKINEQVGTHQYYADLCDRCGDAVYNWDMHRFNEPRPFVSAQPLSPRPTPVIKGPYTIFGESKGYGHYEVCYTWDLERGRRDPASSAYWLSGNMRAFDD